MSELTEAARALRLKAIRQRDEHAYAVWVSGAMETAAIDRRWLLAEVDRLSAELAEEEADREQFAIHEEAKRLDVEDQLKQAERTIRELRDKIEYWEMDQ